MTTLRVALLQMPLVWQSPEKNRAAITERLEVLPACDLILLPEMFTTGFSATDMTGAEATDGETVRWMQTLADEKQAAVYGSLKIRLADSCVNRAFLAEPDGTLTNYDKRHLFRMAGEHEKFSQGRERVVVHFRGFRLLLQICYDLRFPVWMRNQNDYDAALVVANWPQARRDAWRTLLRARAIENAAYVVGVNRVGSDGAGVEYAGDSLAVDFKGQVMADLAAADTHALVTLDLAGLKRFREKFPVHLDADTFALKPE